MTKRVVSNKAEMQITKFPVDGIKTVATHNHLLRIECVDLGPNNEERSAGTLLIPGDRASGILRALMQAVHELDKKVRQSATTGQTAN